MEKKKSKFKKSLGRDPFEGMDMTWIDGSEENVDPRVEQEDIEGSQKDTQSDVQTEQLMAEATPGREETEVEGREASKPTTDPEEIDFSQLLDEPAEMLEIEAGISDQISVLREELTTVFDSEAQPVSDLSGAADMDLVILPADEGEREDLTVGSGGGPKAPNRMSEDTRSAADLDQEIADLEQGSEPEILETEIPADLLTTAKETDLSNRLETPIDKPKEDPDPHEQTTPPLEQLIDQINREVGQLSDDGETDVSLEQRLDVRDQYIRFLLDDILLAIPLASALEVGQQPKITPLPNLPKWVLGISNIRGEIISVVDLKRFFERPSDGLKKRSRLLVVHSEDTKLALVVDKIMGIVSLDRVDTSIQQSPYKEGGISAFILGVAMTEDKLLNILDIDKLFSSLRTVT